MEISSSSSSRLHEREKNPSSPNNSPNSFSASNNGGLLPHNPKLLPRSESNPYPTTFVQADSSNFKHVVQMLTGSSDSPKPPPPSSHDPFQSSKSFAIPPIKTAPKKQQSFKLYERRNHLKNSLMINTLIPNFAGVGAGAGAGAFSPRNAEILSPSILDFPSLALSPVTPLNDDPLFEKSSSSPSLGSSSEEERAIAEKGFYLHPSPMNTPRAAEPPQLLSLFPETSPRVSGSSSSS
ncbi:VQ motif-containing protein 4 [Momordica charantia]|uniref:VQ motif-containing protein 4 n=1 Tax=Momordica charantia TaxID=3673 RepID=A0A6J1CC93_MOMCH|nr:VQ motif-containing protein 4 [Momordica charantia]